SLRFSAGYRAPGVGPLLFPAALRAAAWRNARGFAPLPAAAVGCRLCCRARPRLFPCARPLLRHCFVAGVTVPVRGGSAPGFPDKLHAARPTRWPMSRHPVVAAPVRFAGLPTACAPVGAAASFLVRVQAPGESGPYATAHRRKQLVFFALSPLRPDAPCPPRLWR